MKWVSGALLSAGLLVVACLIGAPSASATTVDLDFKGYLTSTFNGGNDYSLFGTEVTGVVSYSDDSSTNGASTSFNHVNWTFNVDGVLTTSGSRDFPGGQVNITNSGSDITVGLNSLFGDFQLNFEWGPTAQLLSLANFPASQSVAASLYGWLSGNGNFSKDGTTYLFNVFAFNANVSNVATTPIPGAIWLFLSALGGLGGMRWFRRRSAATAA